MDLTDATLMFWAESAPWPGVASIAQSAFDQLSERGEVDYQVLRQLLGEASGKGVLLAIRAKYSAAAYEALLSPICAEIGRQAPIPPRRAAAHRSESDPLTDPSFSRRYRPEYRT